MSLQAAHRWILDQQSTLVSRIERWCGISSGSTNLDGLRVMADQLEIDFNGLATACDRIKLPGFATIDDHGESSERLSGPLLVWRGRPQATRRVLLMIHYDTVYQPHDQPRLCQLEEDHFLVGPGAADAKGGIAVMLTALECVERFGLAKGVGWTAILNPDEEIGSPASWPILQAEASQYDFGLLFEPAMPDGALVSGRKGSGNYTLVMRGRSAHSGRNPQEGRNAVVALAKMATAIDGLSDHSHGIAVNVASLRGGGPLNRVPDLAVLRVNVRTADPAALARFQREFLDVISAHRHPDYPCSVFGGVHAPPKPASEPAGVRLREAVERSAIQCGRSVIWRESGGASDGNKLAAAGLPNVDSLGPHGFDLHSPRERCDLRTLVPAAQTIVQLLEDYSNGRFGWFQPPPPLASDADSSGASN